MALPRGKKIAIVRAARTDELLEKIKMAWNAPKIVEIPLGAEINCYACAEQNA